MADIVSVVVHWIKILLPILILLTFFIVLIKGIKKKDKKRIFVSAGCIILILLGINIINLIMFYTSEHTEPWYFDTMQMQQISEVSGGATQTIAFIDTGISGQYADYLGDRIIYQYNVIEKNDDVQDLNGHGTEMISIACGDGYYGVYGMAFEANIIVIKAVGDDGVTNNAYLLDALNLAEEHGATIINVSLGGMKRDENVSEKIEELYQQNIVVVAAAGDYQDRDLLFPAVSESAFAVEGSGKDGMLWEMSNISEETDETVIRFPAEEIEAIYVDDQEGLTPVEVSGTSCSTALASAYIACVRDCYRQKNEELNNDILKEILCELDTRAGERVDFMQPFD